MGDFFGWGPVSEGTGPDVTMIVFYHLDEMGRVLHLEPGATRLLRKAQVANVVVGSSAVPGSGSSFRTKDDVRRYIGFFSGNDFGKASEFWAPELEVRLGKLQVIQGREENVKFFSQQRLNGMDENVAPKQITLDDSCCVLHAEVTFTARKDFPEVRQHFHVETCARMCVCAIEHAILRCSKNNRRQGFVATHKPVYLANVYRATGVCGDGHDVRRYKDWSEDLERDDDFV